MGERTRKYKLSLHLSEEEKYILEEKTKLANMKSKNAFLRNLIIYGYVYDVNYDGLNKYNKELNAIGNNINQIVALCRKTGNVYPEDIKEIKELMEKVWHTHESMLSDQQFKNQ